MKWLGAILLVVAAFLFFIAGQGGLPLVSILAFGLAAGIAGLWLWDEGAERLQSEKDDVTQLLQQKMERLESLLLAMQEDFGKVEEEREFLGKLYQGSGAGTLPPPPHE